MAVQSKNSKNSSGTKQKQTGKMVTSEICESCKNPCTKGKLYLQKLKQKHEGKGVYCSHI